MVPGSHIVPYADCYRCPLELDLPVVRRRLRRGRAQAGQDRSRAGAVAAVIVEPMQGTAGNIVPPDDFLPAVRSIADEARRAPHRRRDDHRLRPHRASYWGVDHTRRPPRHRHDRQGVRRRLPARAASLTTDEIAQAKPWSNPSGSSSSYGGNPLGAAAGAAALRVIDEEDLVENARVVGAAMLARARALRRRLPLRRHRARARALPRHRARARQDRRRSRCRAR